jgi:hypothetical protein
MPVPSRVTTCGLFSALSATCRELVLDPVVEGTNARVIVQAAFHVRVVPQVLAVWVKSAASAPRIFVEAIVTSTPVLLVSVTSFVTLVVPRAALPNDSVFGANESGAIPVPVRLTVCVPALSFTDRIADRGPGAEGTNVTVILQPVPTETLAPHVVVSAKLPLFVPVMVTAVTDRVMPPVLESVTDCGELVLPTDKSPKGRLAGLTVAAGPLGPVTVSVIATDVAPVKLASPKYCAVIECVPAVKPLVVKEADALLKATDANETVPSKKFTIPVGTPLPAGETVAVKVTGVFSDTFRFEDRSPTEDVA